MSKVLITLFLFVNLAYSFTMGDAIKEIRLLIRDSSADTVNQRYTDNELYRRIELAQDAIIRRSGAVEKQSRITTVAGVSNYSLPSSCVEIRRVEFATSTATEPYLLNYLNKRKLDTMDKDWRSDTGKPVYWTDIFFSSAVITIYPTPTSSYAVTNGLTCYYISKSDSYTTYTSSTAIFDGRPMLAPYYEFVFYYVARLCMLDEGDFADASDFKKLYDEGIQTIIIELNSQTLERTLKNNVVAPQK